MRVIESYHVQKIFLVLWIMVFESKAYLRLYMEFFEKTRDDGVNFQWGGRYIRAYEVIEGLGGKYWRDNGDGTMTMFYHPINTFRSFVNNLCDSPSHRSINRDSMKIDEENYTITFENKTDFINALRDITESKFVRDVERVGIKSREGLTLVLDIHSEVIEDEQEIIRS